MKKTDSPSDKEKYSLDKAFFIEEKVKRILALGVDHVVVAQFNEDYLNRSVHHFINDLLAFHPIEIIVGSDFRFGKNRSGGSRS